MGLHEPSPGHADAASSSNHDVVQDPNANHPQGFHKLFGDGSVCCRRFCNTAWMVVAQDAGCCIDVQSSSDSFPKVDAGPIDGAGKKFLAIQDSVAIVQPHDVKFFMKQST